MLKPFTVKKVEKDRTHAFLSDYSQSPVLNQLPTMGLKLTESN